MMDKLVQRKDAARMLGVSASTMTRWAKGGLVPTIKTVGGHHRYFLSDIEQLRAQQMGGSDRRAVAVGAKSWEEDGSSVDLEFGPLPFSIRDFGPRAPSQTGDMVEIRWHGRGGQGVVTAAELLAEAALMEGRYFQAFPEFGAERTGAPVQAYTRLSSHPINLHCPILEPAIAIVLDSTLLRAVNVFEGLLDDGIALINSPLPPGELAPEFVNGSRRLFTVDATRIVLDTLRRNIPNTAMLGALLRVSPVVEKNTCLDVIERRLSAKFSSRVVQANVDAFQRAYSEVKED